MVFCDQRMAARIEAAEVAMLRAAAAVVARRDASTAVVDVGGGIAVMTEAGSPLNKIAGLGFAPFDASTWATIAERYRSRGLPAQVELSTLADPVLGVHFTTHGHRLVGVENVLGRRVGDVDRVLASSDLELQPIGVERFDEWLDVMVTGFGTVDVQGVGSHEQFDRDVLRRVVGDFAGADGMTLLLATRAGVAVGAASLRVQDGIAQLCGAATLPPFRRQGVQSALLAARLALAAERGAELAVMTALPGSRSMQNAVRQGFALLYARNILVRDADAAVSSPST